VARDLHDSTGQTLTALKISVVLLQRKLGDDNEIKEELSQIERLAESALQEIRTTSYLLHPPLLDEAGFASAAKWYIEGFARRSGMSVRTDFGQEAERLPTTVEIALFRVLQESLTNVHRHAGTSEVDVNFRREPQTRILEIRDYGRGIPKRLMTRMGTPVRDSGVGLAGMRERLNELSGDLEIERADPGTMVRAIVPVEDGPRLLAFR
jgi:signal transduction histidine kinase